LNAKLLVIVTVQVIVSPPEEPVLLHWSTAPLVGAAAILGPALRVLVELRPPVLESVVRVDSLPLGAGLPRLEVQIVLGANPAADALSDVGAMVGADSALGA
jgi:hypothetical protein